MFAVILTIVLMLAIQFSTRINAERQLFVIQDTILDEIDLLRREQVDLTNELAYLGSDAYVESWARSEGRMVKEGEVLVIPVPLEATLLTQQESPVIDSSVVETTLPDPESWHLWWSLFFDGPPPVLSLES
jgi:cell division protein FtsB